MKRHRNFAISSILLILLTCGLAWARSVSKTEAEKAVKGWLKIDHKPLNATLGSKVEMTDVFSGDDGSPVYYVIYLKPSGFVIAPADDMVEPVVGFVAGNAHYDPSPENPLGALVSRDMAYRVDIARKVQAKWDAGVRKKNLTEEETVREDKAVKAKGKWSKFHEYADSGAVTSLTVISDVRVAPLVQSQWSQSTECGYSCYNYYTPPNEAGDTNNCVCGCVATAVAQLMRFHQYPPAPSTLGPFTIWVDGVSQQHSLMGGNYAWSDMVLDPDCLTTLTQRQAIGVLTHDVGVAVHMQYTSGSSVASMHDAKDALLNTFFYANAIMGGDENKNIGSGLNGMINPNLDAGYPVILGIYNGSVGHAVVADGYGYSSSTLYHHINMGWGGFCDAWYNLPNVDDGYYNFNVVNACIYNVYTSGSGEIISGRVTDASGNPISGATVTATGPGGPYTVTSDSNGIYALAKVRFTSTYTVSVTAPGRCFTSQSVITGTSINGHSPSGNKWGVNFVAPDSLPQPPSSISYPSDSNSGRYTVNWSISDGATSYQLERSSNGGSNWSQIYSDSNTSYTENIGDGSYRYRVQATNAMGSSDWTTGTWDCEVLSPPDLIDYPSSNTTGQYNVSWSLSGGATSYQLERSRNGGSNWSQVYSGSNTVYTENIGDGSYRYRVQAANAMGWMDWTTGTWDCEVILPPLPPGFARNPSLPFREVDVSPTVILTWTPGAYVGAYTTGQGGNGHHVFFNTDSMSLYPATGSGTKYSLGTRYGHYRTTSASFDPNHCIIDNSGTYGRTGYGYPLPLDKTFYWSIMEVNNANTGSPWKGTIWSFKTTNGKAKELIPTNGATGVNTIADLSWTAGSGATSHDVYFGTASPGEFKGNQTATTYDPGTLAYNTTYYWRIDEKNAGGIITGIIWNFTTATGAGDFDGNGREDFADFAILANAWQTHNGDAKWNAACDISTPSDNTIDWRDLVIFVEEWLVGVE